MQNEKKKLKNIDFTSKDLQVKHFTKWYKNNLKIADYRVESTSLT